VRTEITTLAGLAEHREAGGDLRSAVLVGLDLTGAEDLLRTALDGAVLLGCELTERSRRQVEAAGGLIFPAVPQLPYEVYRTSLYAPEELFAGFDPGRPESYADTLDARIYRYAMSEGREPDALDALAQRLHDHSITSALQHTLTKAAACGRANPVAVMGGHALTRSSPGYATAAELGAALGACAAGFTVLTGGGPGAMEAVPLGVQHGEHLPSALAALAKSPEFGGSPADIGAWLAPAIDLGLSVVDDCPRTIGIPTWFYGHEPPNAFQWHAKYFANSVREDGLLEIATGGIVYTPGSAGTVQEVFQDYTQNHYGTTGPPAPMIFLGKDFWTAQVPAAPLVQQLSRGREAERWILVTDDIAEAVEMLATYAAESR
jgi:predicted Rossmann-fold nucleotide-binding protein